MSTRQNFKNILLPYNIRSEVYNSNKGWAMIKNKYNASSKGIILNKAIYKVTLENGTQKRNITINALDIDNGVVAKN